MIENCFKIVNRQYVEQKTVIKEFYWYQYERWYMGKGWSVPMAMFEYEFADVTWRIKLAPKTVAP